MRANGILLAATLVLTSGPAIAGLPGDGQTAARSANHSPATYVAEAAQRFGLPEAWIWAVIRVESRGDPRAVSPAGAMGLMQVMPATWATMRARYGLGADPFDAHDNIVAGAAFLHLMLDRYGNPAAMLAAYNAGPGRYDDWLARRRPLPAETVAYLAQLSDMTSGTDIVDAAPDPLAWTRAPLFIRTGMTGATTEAQPPGNVPAAPVPRIAAAGDTPADTLFVARLSAGSAP